MKSYLLFVYLLLTTTSIRPMNMRIALDDGTVHSVTAYEIEKSTTLLHKKLLREKTTASHVTQWGYNKALYKKLQKSPLYVHNINQESFNLFRGALHVRPTQFKEYFDKLRPEQQQNLYELSSEQVLGVPYLVTQLCDVTLLPELIKHAIEPHFLTKQIVDYMRNNIIIHNARKKHFTQKTEPLAGEDVELKFNPIFNAFMMIPTALIKNECYLFDGRVGRITITLEGQQWTRVRDYQINEFLRYVVTPCITDEECAQQSVKRFPNDKYILWITDASDTVLHKQFFECGGIINDMQLSPNGDSLVVTSHKTDNHPYNKLVVIPLDPTSATSYDPITLSDTTTEIMSLCFNAQATILAVGSTGHKNQETIHLWNMQTNSLLSALTGHVGVVSTLQFNHVGTRMISASLIQGPMNTHILKIMIWNTIDCENIQKIKEHCLMNIEVIHSCCFSPDNTRIIITLTLGTIILFNGITGEKIAHIKRTSPLPLSVSSICSANSRFLASTLLGQNQKHTRNTVLYDLHDGTYIATLVENQLHTCGIGFTPDKRHIVTVSSTGQPEGHHITTTALFDQETDNALKWLQKESSLAQKYALYNAYNAIQANSHPSIKYSTKLLYAMLSNKTEQSKKVKKIVKKYL